MKPEAFRRRAGEMWEEIPVGFREGVEALVVTEETIPHPELSGIFTMGECVTDSWPSGYSEAGDVRSRVYLYHGSFEELDARDPAFEWEAELWETLLHELLHHREWAAAEDGLDVYDRAAEHNFRRHAGRSFDPGFYRALPADEEGGVRLESETFVEARRGEREDRAAFEWRGREYTAVVPRTGEVLYVNPINLAPGRLWAVVWPEEPWWRRLGLVRPSDREAREIYRRVLPTPRRRG